MAALDLKNIETSILRRTIELVKLYNTNSDFRLSFEKNLANLRATFRGLPLKTYIKVISSSPNYRRYEKETRGSADKVREMLISFYQDPRGLGQFEKDVILGKFTSNLTSDELKLIEQIDTLPPGDTRMEKHDKTPQPTFSAQPTKQLTEQPEVITTPTTTSTPPVSTVSQPQFTLPKIQLPSFGKNLLSSAQIGARKILIRFAPNLLSGTIGGIIGSVIVPGAGGVIGGVIGGGLLPNVLKSSAFRSVVGGGTKAAAGAALKGAGAAAGALSGPPGWVVTAGTFLITTTTGRNIIKYSIIGIIGFFFLPIFLGLNKQISFFPPPGAVETANLPPGYIEPSSDISSCKFTRSGESFPLKSTALLGWINEVAIKESVPAAILASIAIHENPNFVLNEDNNNENIKNNNFCQPGRVFCELKGKNLHMGVCNLEEIDGGAQNGQAIGLMQIIDIYNKDINLCDIQENIARGAQILKNKLGSGSFDNASQTRQAVCAYYGAESPGGCKYGANFDYGQEAWEDLQNCKNSQPAQNIATTTVLNKIVQEAQSIVQLLSNGANKLFYIKSDERGVIYYCTYLIVDSYNRAGITGMDRSRHGWTCNMKDYFANTNSYTFLPPDTTIDSLRPGDVIFLWDRDYQQCSGAGTVQHVSLIKSIDIDPVNGHGVVETYDANSFAVINKLSVSNFLVKDRGGIYKIGGFGQFKGAI